MNFAKAFYTVVYMGPPLCASHQNTKCNFFNTISYYKIYDNDSYYVLFCMEKKKY